MTVNDLKDELRNRKLLLQGNKETLVQRLLAAGFQVTTYLLLRPN